MAETDALTGLSNRRMLDRLVRTALLHAESFGIELIIGIIDIDDFKEVNDTYGHSAGDRVLITISGILAREIGKNKSSLLGRWGGEEFLFIIPNIDMEKARGRMDEILGCVEAEDFEEIGKKTISVGLTSFVSGDSADDVFKRADEALYEAKRTGKNRVCVKEK